MLFVRLHFKQYPFDKPSTTVGSKAIPLLSSNVNIKRLENKQ